jgi:hypothetical protein
MPRLFRANTYQSTDALTDSDRIRGTKIAGRREQGYARTA